MRIVWTTLWFLDYRIPVFRELSQIKGVEFYLIYNKEVNSEGINNKIKASLGDRAIALTGEKKLGSNSVSGFANKSYRIPYQPRLIRSIKKLKPDVMISDGFFQWTYAPLFVRATKGIPHVMCYERTKHTERNAQLIRKCYRKFALKWIDVVCCSGKLCGEYVKSLGFDSGRTTFGHMVADVEDLNSRIEDLNILHTRRLREKLGVNGTVYLFVGRLIELKGVRQLLSAWSDFTINLSEKPFLIIVGGGEQEELIKKIILEKHLETVRLVGNVSYNDIGDYYSIADIFVIPTLEDNWSLVVSEAMACKLPIITSVYNGCWPELVQESNGWVMDPLNHEELVRTLLDSYTKRACFKRMGEASLQIVTNYTAKTAAKSIFDSCILAINLNK